MLEKLVLGVMFTLVVGGVIIVIGSMVVGQMDYNEFSYISLSGE